MRGIIDTTSIMKIHESINLTPGKVEIKYKREIQYNQCYPYNKPTNHKDGSTMWNNQINVTQNRKKLTKRED
jgi:hypothetical protein